MTDDDNRSSIANRHALRKNQAPAIGIPEIHCATGDHIEVSR
jgi:hypothetical protein